MDDVLRVVGPSLRDVEAGIRDALADASDEGQRVMMHLVQGGGKRVRPLLALISARVFSPSAERAVPVGVAAELIHMATLVHDDVIDEAQTRRGRKTVNRLWGNHVSVLAGDALLAKSLLILVDQTDLRIVRIMSEMIYQMCEGEIAQHASLRKVSQREEDYYDRIEKKTALFFAACCRAGALLGGADEAESEAMWAYGRHLGMAFQVIDDLLDVSADEQVVGKPVGHDLISGVLTLPVLYLLRDERHRDRVAGIIGKGDAITKTDVHEVLDLVRTNGAIEYTLQKARDFAGAARASLAGLPAGEPKELLMALSDSVLTRKF